MKFTPRFGMQVISTTRMQSMEILVDSDKQTGFKYSKRQLGEDDSNDKESTNNASRHEESTNTASKRKKRKARK